VPGLESRPPTKKFDDILVGYITLNVNGGNSNKIIDVAIMQRILELYRQDKDIIILI